MTQFQQSASVRTLDTSERAYPAPFLAIVAGLVAVLIAVAAISFAVDAQPSDAAVGGYADTTAADRYVAGLTAGINQYRLEAAQQLNDGWAAALAMQRPITATDGWEKSLVRDAQAEGRAAADAMQRPINATHGWTLTRHGDDQIKRLPTPE